MKLKKLIRRARVGKDAMQIPLCILLVNIRSYCYYGGRGFLNKTLKQKSLHREYGIKSQILQKFRLKALEQYAYKPKFGNQTYLWEDGSYKSYPEGGEIPF